MRRQFHGRHTSSGFLAWDVHRLVELARDLPVIEVPLVKIRELDECYWFDAGGGAPTCRAIALHARLIAESDLDYPVILSADGRVMDGMHRICRAVVEGRESVLAVRFEKDPEPDHVDVPLEELPCEEPPRNDLRRRAGGAQGSDG